jgi:hypothetical protein
MTRRDFLLDLLVGFCRASMPFVAVWLAYLFGGSRDTVILCGVFTIVVEGAGERIVRAIEKSKT